MVKSKRILLIVSGGIAAYKSLELIRRLRERGFSVRVVMTKAAQEFVSPLSFAALSGQKVYTELFALTDEAEMGHIELSRDADLVVAVPATANIMGKLASGIADDLASTLLLATDTKILMAPAMNLRMWLNPATQRNLETLLRDGVIFVGPNDGDMACGEFGPGRMAEPLEIAAAIENCLKQPTKIPAPGAAASPSSGSKPMAGRHVLLTSGPTHEPIDPVRYIANRSSGRQGHAIAAAARDAGARVTLVSGPVPIAAPHGVNLVSVETAQQMYDAVHAHLPADIFIGAAAVADWKVSAPSKGKIKKTGDGPPALSLSENPDILASIGKLKKGRPLYVAGFAAETGELEKNGRAKLVKKACDLIVANDVNPETGVMGGDFNTVRLITKAGIEDWPILPKEEVANQLIARIAKLVSELKR